MKNVLFKLSIALNIIFISAIAGGEDSGGAQTGILIEEFLNYRAPAYWKGGQVDWRRCADTAQTLGEFEYSIKRDYLSGLNIMIRRVTYLI